METDATTRNWCVRCGSCCAGSGQRGLIVLGAPRRMRVLHNEERNCETLPLLENACLYCAAWPGPASLYRRVGGRGGAWRGVVWESSFPSASYRLQQAAPCHAREVRRAPLTALHSLGLRSDTIVTDCHSLADRSMGIDLDRSYIIETTKEWILSSTAHVGVRHTISLALRVSRAGAYGWISVRVRSHSKCHNMCTCCVKTRLGLSF